MPFCRCSVTFSALLLASSFPGASASAQDAQAPSAAWSDPGAALSTAERHSYERADAEMRLVLAKMHQLQIKPVEQLTVEQARSQPTPADAVNALLVGQGKDPAALMTAMNVTASDSSYVSGGAALPIRIYKPAATATPMPVIVYYHGGGWVLASIETYETSAMALAKKANAIVASVEYRKAPEAKYPAALEDAFAAYQWVLDKAAQFGGDPTRIAVAGESAGGNLALNTAILARDKGVTLPLHMLLIYPVAGTDLNTQSYQAHGQAAPLSKAGMQWFYTQVANGAGDFANPMLNLYARTDLKGLPPATILNAEIDPLASDGGLLADALRQQGVTATRQVYTGVTHEFFGMDAVVEKAAQAQEAAASQLRDAFARAASRPSVRR